MSKELQINEIKALYFDHVALTPPSYKLTELTIGKKRLYAWLRFTQNAIIPVFYPSVTTVLHEIIYSSFLSEWRGSLGNVEADRIMNERALYGSMLHTQLTNLLLEGKYSLDETNVIVEQYCRINNILLKPEWVWELKKDMLAFTQWLIDYEVKPIMIEGALKSDMQTIAGRLDLFCELTIEVKGFFGEVYKTGERKGEPKESKQKERKLAIVDYKSSKSGSFYLSHELQLEFYKTLLIETFVELRPKEVLLFNWSPKDWQSEPGYNFKDQTFKHSQEVLTAIMTIYNHINKSADDTAFNTIRGMINLNKENPLENIHTKQTLHEHFRTHNQDGKPTIPHADSRDDQGRGETNEPTGEDLPSIAGLF